MSSLRLKTVLRRAFPHGNLDKFTFKMGKWSTWRHLRGRPVARNNIQNIIESFKIQNRGRLQDATCLLDPYKEAIEVLRRKYFPLTPNCCTYCKNNRTFDMPYLDDMRGDYSLNELYLAQFEESVYYVEKLRDLDNNIFFSSYSFIKE